MNRRSRASSLLFRAASIFLPALLLLVTGCLAPDSQGRVGAFGLVVHGGAGTIRRESMTPEREAEFRAALTEALEVGHHVLASGGTSLDAVEAAVVILEDSPHFNAGKGAVFTSAGANELDASIMDGATLEGGAVASVTRVKNPVRLARRVMEKTPHVLLVREGAEVFATEQGIELVPPDYFRTERRWKQLERVKARAQARTTTSTDPFASVGKFGTVGAVALDRHGNLAAATSTGGLTNKLYGRVGDSPILGAGTYADNETCALSGTGRGEYFIRLAACHEVASRMRHRGESLLEAMRQVVHVDLVELGAASGGLIGIDRQGRYALEFNTPGMYRGVIDESGQVTVKIFGENPEE